MRLCCLRGASPRMTTRERLFLTPVEKCMKYGIVPWKLILNLLLVGLVTSHVVLMNSQESNYVQAASRAWYKFFYPSDYDFSDPVWYTFTVNDTADALAYAIDNYYSLNDISPDVYQYSYDNEGEIVFPTLTVTSYTDITALFDPSRSFQPTTDVQQFALNETWLGPLDPSVPYTDMADFFHSLVRMELEFPPIQHFAFGTLYRNCFLWSLTVEYDFTNRGQIRYTMDQDVIGTCDVFTSAADVLQSKFMWMNVVIMVISVLHSALIIRAIARSLRLMCRLTRWAAAQAKQLAEEARAAGIDLAEHGIDEDDDDEKGAATAAGTPGQNDLKSGLLAGDSLNGTAQATMKPSPLSGPGSPAVRRQPSARMQIDIQTDMDVDGTGEVFVTATDTSPALARRGNRHTSFALPPPARGPETIVFTPGDTADGTSAQPRPVGDRRPSAVYGTVPLAPAGEGHGGADGVHVELEMRPGVSAAGGAQAVNAGDDAGKLRLIAAARAARALSVSWRSLQWRDRVRFINGWAFLSLASDACNIASCALNLHRKTAHIPSDEGHAFLMGFGLALLWVGVLRYMEHNRTYFNIVLTLRRAGPRVLRFLVGVLPIFIAYSLFAVVMFADRVPRFCDVRTAFITLFANLNGDVVRETMMAMVAYQPVVAQLFFYSFIALHIYVVLNIIIAVVEESYFITLTKTQEMAERREEDAARAREAEEAARRALQQPWQPIAAREGSTISLPSLSKTTTAKADATKVAGTAVAAVVPPQHPGAPASGALHLFSSLPPDVLATGTAPHTDSNSLKDRPDSQFTALLRLSEWDEVLTGAPIRSRGRAAAPTSTSGLAHDAHTRSATSASPSPAPRGRTAPKQSLADGQSHC